jgi:hypothetical protein
VAECARVVRVDKGRIARVVVFVLVQMVCIHPAVSYRVRLARVLQRETTDAARVSSAHPAHTRHYAGATNGAAAGVHRAATAPAAAER